MLTTSPPSPTSQLVLPLVKNGILMALSGAVGAFVLILSVPIIVARLGPEGYGVWECMLAVSSTAMVFQAAINGTLLWRISLNCGFQNASECRRLVSMGVGATILLIVVFVPTVWFWRNSIVSGLNVPEQWIAQTRWLLPQIVLLMLLGGVNQALLALIAGYQKAGLAALIQSLGLVVTHVTAIGVLLAGGNLNALLWGMIAGFFVVLLVSYAVATALCGRLPLWPSMPSSQDLVVLAPFVGLLILSNLTLVLRDHIDKLLLASWGSPAEAGNFAIAQRFSLVVMQVGGTVCLPLTAAVGSLYAVQNWNAIRHLYAQVSTWLVISTGLLGFLICTLREPLFVLWLGADQPQAQGYLVVLLFGGTSALVFSGAGVALAKGVGRPGLETAYTVVTCVLILITKPALIAVLGAGGCVISSALSWCLGAIYFLFMLHRRLDLPREIIARSGGIFLLTVVVSTIGWILTSRFSLSASGRLEAALLLVVAGLPLVACYLGVLTLFRLIPTPFRLFSILREPQVAVLKETSA